MLITNYKLITEKYFSDNKSIQVLINKRLISIQLGSIYYINKNLDVSIIEIKINKKINILDIDDDIYNEESGKYLNKESIYIIHYDLWNNI